MTAEPLHGKLPQETLQAWIDSAASALPVESPGGRLTGEALATVRRNPILSALFGRIRDDLGQFDVHGLDADGLAKAAQRLMRDPETLAREVADASPFMAARLKDHMAEMTEAAREALRDEAPWSKGHDTFLDASQRYAFDLTAWTAAYSKAVEAGATDPVATADAVVPARTEPGTSIGRLLPSFAAYSTKSGNAHLTGQPANAQSLYWLGTLSPALSAARLPDTSALRPWLPTAGHTTLPPLPTLPTSAKGAKGPAPGSLKDIHDPATLAAALTAMSDKAATSLESTTSEVSNARHLMQPEPDAYGEMTLSDVAPQSIASDKAVIDSESTTHSPLPQSYMKAGVEIDMRSAPGGSGVNAAGFLRNGPWFWRQLAKSNPEYFDVTNRARIRAGRSPKINQTWIDEFPTHQGYSGGRLVHHHIDQGPIATPIPEAVHQTWYKALHPNQ